MEKYYEDDNFLYLVVEVTDLSSRLGKKSIASSNVSCRWQR